MKNESVRMKGMAMVAMAAIVLSAFVPVCLFTGEADADEAEPDYTFYRYTIKFFSTSQDAKYLVWDFADGTVLDGRWEHYVELQNNGEELSEEILAGIEAYQALLAENGNSIYCPIHTYSAPGIYTYSITAYNPIGYVGESGMAYDGVFSSDDEGYDGGLISGSEDASVCGSFDVAYITLDVKGFPVITLVNDGSTSALTVENTDIYTKATEPADSVKDGFDFTGWFTDAACTQAYNWNSIVDHNITLYAGWENVSGPVTPEPEVVTLSVNGTPVVLELGKKVSDLTIVPKEGFEFAGWYSDSTFTHEVAGNTVLANGMSLFAKYNAVQNGPVDDPSDEPTDDPRPEPVTEDDKTDYIPYAVAVIGILVLLIGLRYHPAIFIVGILIALAGVIDIAGIYEVF